MTPASASQRAAVVLDTNVVLDWLVFRDPHTQALAASLAAGAVRWLVTPPMQDELAQVLGREALARRASAAAVLDVAARHWQVSPAGPVPAAPRCDDPDDQMFIELALAQRAAWLVTRDKAVLKLARHLGRHGTAVVTPRHWPAAPARLANAAAAR